MPRDNRIAMPQYSRNFTLTPRQLEALASLAKAPMVKSTAKVEPDQIRGNTANSLVRYGLARESSHRMIEITPNGKKALAAWREKETR